MRGKYKIKKKNVERLERYVKQHETRLSNIDWHKESVDHDSLELQPTRVLDR